ncbi:hypothetical protein GCM10010922_07100 [Microbacterium sorbitolivorans]|nr:hypothetical protein GCM10010922_07100 [Microbacterium sorbitolivorans]
MHVRVDLRGDLRRGLQAHVEVETDLGEEGQVGSQAGGDEDPSSRPEASAVLRDEHGLVAVDDDLLGAEPGDEIDEAVFDGTLRPLPERAPLGQFVGAAAAEGVADRAAPQHPGDPRPRRALGHSRKDPDRRRRGVPVADHHDVLARQGTGVLDGGHAVLQEACA